MTTETRLELAAKLGAKEAKRALDTRCPFPRDDVRREAYIDGFMRAVAAYDEPAREEPETDDAPPVDGEGSEETEGLLTELDGSGAEAPPFSDEVREAPERVDEELADAPGGDDAPPADAPEHVDDEPVREEPAS